MANIIQINGKKVKDVNAARMSSLAPVETGTTATAAHAVEEYFWLGGVLCEATDAITVGDSITVGKNCKVVDGVLADLKIQSQSDWNQATTTAKDYIKNKPVICQQANGGILENGATDASGQYSHAEGDLTTASGACSHAEGGSTTASGSTSHAEGAGTTASGDCSHAEGGSTNATGNFSHAEGAGTIASGDCSHADGQGTTANHRAQHVFGNYNVPDDSIQSSSEMGNYVEIVGNGSNNNNRSNARTLDWNGNESLAGSITLGKGTADEVTLSAAQLKQLLALLN